MTERTNAKERREERQHALGIDCVDRLTWKEWTPGNEYTRKILVKNVDRTSQTIQLSLPVHKKIFLTPYPEPVTLSSGVSHEIAITFRPVELAELHDAITITVEGRGAFQVRLDCLTPYARLSMPSTYDFDYCAIGATAHAEVQLRNSGTAPVEFTWDAPAPFCVLPKHAVLDQGEAMHLTLLFTPTDACTMVGQAVCRLTGVDEVIATLKVSGIGKYPYICFQDGGDTDNEAGAAGKTSTSGSTSSSMVSSGTLAVSMEGRMGGPVVTKEVRVHNPSAVAATVRLQRSDDSTFSAFAIAIDGAASDALNAGEPFVIPRSTTQVVRVHYNPSSPGVLQSGVFQLDCLEGNTLQLELSGTTIGPRVTTSASSFDFGAIDLERLPTLKQRTRHLTLRNPTAVEATFALLNTAPGAAFVVQPHQGTVPAHSTLQVAVTFQPAHPVLYYRRLHLLVEGAAEVVFVDVFGGAYNTTVRPPALTLSDVEAALLRAARGLGLLTPFELENIAAAAAAEDADDMSMEHNANAAAAHHQHPPVSPATLEVWRRTEEDARGGGVVMRGAKPRNRASLCDLETVNGVVAVNTPFGLDAQPLYTFAPKNGSGTNNSNNNAARGQAVTVMNTSDVSAVATWSVPSPSCPYTVSPAQQVIGPHGSAVFTLQASSSNDSSDDSYALCTLECYVNFESMSAFYLAPDGCVVPPRCFTVACTTSTAAAPTGLPKGAQASTAAQIRAVPQVCLPACRLGGSSYQVIALHNRGGSAARYDVRALLLKHVSAVVLPPDTTRIDPPPAAHQESDVDGSAFSVFPPTGVVPPRARQLLVVKFSPSEPARYEAAATLAWNAPERGADASLAVAPTDSTTLNFLGEVCLPQLQWRDACDAAAVDVVFPPSCVTGEAQQQAWLRNPTALPVAFHADTSAGLLGVLRMEPEWAVVPGGGRLPVTLFFSPQQPRAFTGFLQLHLEDGAAQAEQRQLYRLQLPVHGTGAYAEVEVEPRTLDAGEAADTREQQASLTLYNSGHCEVQYDVRAMPLTSPTTVVPRLHNSRGVLPARTHTTVLVAAQPTPGLTEFLLYALISGLATDLGEVPDATSAAEAARHPHCRWSLRAAHPAVQIVNVHFPGVPRPLAWQQLSLNAVNAQLGTAADAAGEESDDAFSFQHYVSGLVPLTMDLGVDHEAAPTAALTLTLENTGDCPAPFSLMLPTEHDANTEHWSLENTELADLQYIVDRGIITATPSEGVIDVGGTVQLRLAYSHAEVGVHRLPLLLRVGTGERRVAVVLEGRTLPREVQVLNFHHDKVYELLPVALGDMEPPLQYVTVSNPSDEPVNFSVDVAALQAHAQEHYGFPVFQCADPQGSVAPHATARIGFYFRPLEARQYQITVLVQTAEGEGYYVDLVGAGYHPRETPKASVARWIDTARMHVPVAPPLPSPNASPLRLVDDVCTLGAVPYYTLCRRACTLQLAAEAPHALRYAWQSDPLRHGDAQLAVSPMEGVLQPGTQQTVQVSFYAGSTSQLLEHFLRCVVAPQPSHVVAQREGGLVATGHGSRGGHPTRQSQGKGESATAATAFVGAGESLGLLVQARVMPRDDYEALYGKHRLDAAYMPALHGAHVDPALSDVSIQQGGTAASTFASPALAGGPLAKEEARFVESLVDELVRTVVASPSVQESFTALCPPRSVSYAKMRVLRTSTNDSDTSAAGVGGEGVSSQGEALPAPNSNEGNFTAAVLTEGVLEELLRGIISESVAAA